MRNFTQKKKVRLALALALVPAALLVNQAAATEANVVQTDAGLVRGKAGATRVFSGIPYAAPPVNGLRWKAPQPVKPWQGVRDASKLSSACPQQDNPEAPGGSVNEHRKWPRAGM